MLLERHDELGIQSGHEIQKLRLDLQAATDSVTGLRDSLEICEQRATTGERHREACLRDHRDYDPYMTANAKIRLEKQKLQRESSPKWRYNLPPFLSDIDFLHKNKPAPLSHHHKAASDNQIYSGYSVPAPQSFSKKDLDLHPVNC